MSHRWMRTIAAPAAAAVLALGAAACEAEDGGLDPGLEDPALDDGMDTTDGGMDTTDGATTDS